MFGLSRRCSRKLDAVDRHERTGSPEIGYVRFFFFFFSELENWDETLFHRE